MPRLLIGWLLQTRTHGRQVQEVIVLPAHNDPRSTSGEEIGQRSGIAIQAVQTSQDVGEGKRKRAGIAADHRSGSQQFTPVIAIACISETGQPLMGMRLEHGGSRAHDFSPLASQVPGSSDQIKATMRSRKVCCLGKCSLSGSLFCSIDIYHDPMLALPIPYPTWRGGEHRSCNQVFLKERAERFNGPLIKGGQKAGKRCRMRQVRSPKKRHERFGKREESLIKGREGLFPTHGVAKEHHDKINHLVVSHTSACKPYPLLDGFLETQLAEHMS